jgi:glycosyltransferase involved in cell wall biosynthesis
MPDVPLASIIVSSYNYGDYLRSAIDSALSQTYPRTEVVVVDDGSTDNSREIIAGYGDRITPVLKQNGGQASAFNAGFRVSQGERICFLDSDDLLLPTAVEKADTLMRDPHVAKVHWPLRGMDARGTDTGQLFPTGDLPEGDLQASLLSGGPCGYAWPPTSGNLWSRRFLERIFPMPEAEFRICPDLYLSALAPLFGSIGALQEPQGCWRIHGENSSWRDPFEDRLRTLLGRWDYCCDVLRALCRDRGIAIDTEAWKARSWPHAIQRAVQTITELIPPGDAFILVDQEWWEAGDSVAGRRRIPFLERDGQYWGPPPDDATAIREVERLRQTGASFMAFARPAFWWLEYYAGLQDHLCGRFPAVVKNDDLVIFDLRS